MGPGIIARDNIILSDLGYMSQVRGVDGAGIYQIRSATNSKWDNYEQLYKTDDNFSVMKQEIDIKQYHKVQGMRGLFDNVQVDVVIGHVRWATRGILSAENSHPFMLPNLVGAHNGTLRDKRYEHKTKTDSEMMFWDMNERGMEAVLNDLDPDSAFAIVAYDRNQKEVTFARNAKRDLWIATNHNRSVLYWASEKDMLELALRRNGEKDFTCFDVVIGWLITVDVADMTWKTMKQKEPKIFKSKKLKLQEKKPVVTTNYGHNVRNYAPSTAITLPDNPMDVVSNVVSLSNTTDVKVTTEVKREEKPSITVFHQSCKCGKHTLNLLDASFADRGKSQMFRKDGNNYLCTECVTEERAVG